MLSKDIYYVSIKPGIDQAFVVGVIAILDNIYGESTSCWICKKENNLSKGRMVITHCSSIK